MNPYSISLLWTFSILMAGAIALGPLAIYVVGGLLTAYAITALVIS